MPRELKRTPAHAAQRVRYARLAGTARDAAPCARWRRRLLASPQYTLSCLCGATLAITNNMPLVCTACGRIWLEETAETQKRSTG